MGKCVICHDPIEIKERPGSWRTCGKHAKTPPSKEKRNAYNGKYIRDKRKTDGFFKTIQTVRTERFRPKLIYNWSWIV